MARFTDNQQREWNVYIDVNAARAVRKQLGVNILTLEGLNQLSADTILFVDALYLLCEPQCKTRGIGDEEFGKALVGKAIEDAGDAVVDALMDFSPPRQRKLLEQIQTTKRTAEDALAGNLTKLLELMPGVLSPATPASSASTPVP